MTANTTLPAIRLETACPFPQKLSQWAGGTGLVRLTSEVAHDTWAAANYGDGAAPMTDTGERLLAVFAGCYAEGIFAVEDIEWAMEAKPFVNQLAGGRKLSQAVLQRFRRDHGPLLEDCLSRLLYAAWQMRSFVPDRYRVGAEGAGGNRLAEATVEARKRIQLAMQFDLAFSE
jgi:hypothetical protein